MNEWCYYIALYCVLLYTQSALQSCEGGGSLLNHHQCAASTWMMQRPPQDKGASQSHHTPATGGKQRESHRTNQWMGIIRRPWLTWASGGNLARTTGLHPYSLWEVPCVTLWCLFLIVFFIIFVFCWMFSLSFRSPLICYVLLLISSNWVISWRFSIKWILRSSEEGGCDFGPVALLQASRWPPDQTVFSAFEYFVWLLV